MEYLRKHRNVYSDSQGINDAQVGHVVDYLKAQEVNLEEENHTKKFSSKKLVDQWHKTKEQFDLLYDLLKYKDLSQNKQTEAKMWQKKRK